MLTSKHEAMRRYWPSDLLSRSETRVSGGEHCYIMNTLTSVTKRELVITEVRPMKPATKPGREYG